MKHRIEFNVPAQTLEIVGVEGDGTFEEGVAEEVYRILKMCLYRDDFEELQELFLAEGTTQVGDLESDLEIPAGSVTVKPVLTTGEAASYCHVSIRTVVNWIRRGWLKAFTTPGRHRRIHVSDLRDFLSGHDTCHLPREAENRQHNQRRSRP
jgi:excisionase family DNA binding protein